MNKADQQYFELCERILANGNDREDRTGTGTRSVFGHTMRFDLSEGFPLLTSKRTPFLTIVKELTWFISGSTDVGELLRMGVDIWTPDAYRVYKREAKERGETPVSIDVFRANAREHGFDLGSIYGKQWRSWDDSSGWEPIPPIDQLADVIDSIRTNPTSRRHIVSAWNVAELEDMALPPCHVLFQFYVADGKLSCSLYQRSGDVFLGVPFNIASYAALTHLVAHLTGLEVGEFIHTIGDAHIYSNHIEKVVEQLQRPTHPAPTLTIRPSVSSIDDVTYEDFVLTGYESEPPIKAPISVGE